jgi:carbon storage regulator
MLVLSRHVGEKIQIGNDIQVTVLRISPHRIRLGIDCPIETPVHREEVYERIRAWQRRARHDRSGELPPVDDSLNTIGFSVNI